MTWECRMNTTHLYYLGAPEGYTAVMKTTHLYDLGAPEEYTAVTKTTHLYDLGAQEGGVNKCRQVKHLHAVPHRGRQLAHLTGSAQDAGSVAQVVGVAAPRVHTVTGGYCHLQVKHSKPELCTGKTQ